MMENGGARPVARDSDCAGAGWRVAKRALIKQPCVRPMAVEVHDITSEGCGFSSNGNLQPGTRVLLDLPGLEIWSATVIWCHEGRGGLLFTRPIHPSVAAHLGA